MEIMRIFICITLLFCGLFNHDDLETGEIKTLQLLQVTLSQGKQKYFWMLEKSE